MYFQSRIFFVYIIGRVPRPKQYRVLLGCLTFITLELAFDSKLLSLYTEYC